MLGFWIFSLFMQMKVSDWRVSKRGAAEFKPLPPSFPPSLPPLDKIFLSPRSANSLHVNHGLSQSALGRHSEAGRACTVERGETLNGEFLFYLAPPASANVRWAKLRDHVHLVGIAER